jgi:hypothetical protein
MLDYLIGSLAWSAVGFLTGVTATETGWYVRWKLSRGRRHHDNT